MLATGGGCVTREENYAPLAQNGLLFYIDRPLSELPTDGRPLSQQNALSTLFERRAPLYQAFADATVKSTGIPLETAKAGLKAAEALPYTLRS